MEEQIQNQVEETTATEEVENKQESVKMFTQEEVNSLIAKEKARATKNIPSKEELDEFKTWKESQKTDEEKANEINEKLTGLENNNKLLKQEVLLLKKGISEEDVDYVQFKVSKMDGEFVENLDKFLADNPKFTSTKEVKATGVQIKSTPVEQEDGVMAILKARHQELD